MAGIVARMVGKTELLLHQKGELEKLLKECEEVFEEFKGLPPCK